MILQAVPRTQLYEYMHSMSWGGGDGIIRDANDGDVTAQAPLAMKVNVAAFRGFINNRIVWHQSTTETATVTGPTGGSAGDLRRIDKVQYTLGTGVNIKTGTESATPSAPSTDADSLFIATISCRKGMTSIKDADDAANGFITDARTFV